MQWLEALGFHVFCLTMCTYVCQKFVYTIHVSLKGCWRIFMNFGMVTPYDMYMNWLGFQGQRAKGQSHIRS